MYYMDRSLIDYCNPATSGKFQMLPKSCNMIHVGDRIEMLRTKFQYSLQHIKNHQQNDSITEIAVISLNEMGEGVFW